MLEVFAEVAEVAVVQKEFGGFLAGVFVDVLDAIGIDGGRAANDAMHLVALL